MVHVCFVARVTDGLILSESWSDAHHLLPVIKQRAGQLLKRLRHGAKRCSVDDDAGFVFHYYVEDGVCYMALCDQSYPLKLAFAFLEEVSNCFLEELKCEFGTGAVDYQSKIDTIEKPYHFVHFDRTIRKIKMEYSNLHSARSLHRLNSSLIEVASIMRENVEEILHRGERLEDVSRKGSDLRHASTKYAGMARMLNLQKILQKYGVLLMVGLVLLFVAFWRYDSAAEVALGALLFALLGVAFSVWRGSAAPALWCQQWLRLPVLRRKSVAAGPMPMAAGMTWADLA